MKSAALVLILAGSLVTAGCATKRHVQQETAPVIQRVNELDDLTARNTNEIRDVDARTQKGIQGVQTKAEQADQRAASAGQQAEEAQVLASRTASRVQGVETVVANLDNYQPLVEASVHFGFDQDHLTARAKQALDQFAAEVPNTRNYIVEVVGSTDSVGDQNYNYQLSQRRAASVIQYLASQHSIPAHKIFVIGLGQDKPAASNRSTEGRARNRRVDVRLMTSMVEGETQAAETSSVGPQ